MKPVINERKCPAQGQICPAIPGYPEGATNYIVDNNSRLGGRIIFDYEKCSECGICVTRCCGEAIELR